MVSKKGESNKNKGCIGFVFGGIVKVGWLRFFTIAPKKNIEEELQIYREHYGPEAKVRYILHSDPEEIMDKLIQQMAPHRSGDTMLFETQVAKAVTKLKTISGESSCT